MVLNASPGLDKAAEALPSMDFADLNDDTIARWAGSLKDTEDPRSRYTLVSLLAQTGETPERRAGMHAGLAELADRAPVSPDVLRARALLANHACLDHNPGELQVRVRSLLALGVLPCTAERSMYEVVMQTAQDAARYCTRLGYHDLAVQMHEALAGKFPETPLAEEELARADKVRTGKIETTLELIALETEGMRSNKDLEGLRAYYGAIIDHTPMPAIRTVLEAQLTEAERLPAAEEH